MKNRIITNINKLDYVLGERVGFRGPVTLGGIPLGRVSLVCGDQSLRQGFLDNLKTMAESYKVITIEDIPDDGDCRIFDSELLILKVKEPDEGKDIYPKIANQLAINQDIALVVNSNFNLPSAYGLMAHFFSSLTLKFIKEGGKDKMKVVKSAINSFGGHTVTFDSSLFDRPNPDLI